MTKINYIQSGEDAVGKGHATKPDTLNRGVRDLQTLSGLDPDADFAGFALPSQITGEAAARAAADTAAIATAAADATTKANAAQAAAIAAASTDATTKANNAQSAAQSFATSAVGSEATTRAAADVSAIASAKTYADGIMATEQTARGNGDTAAVTSANAHADAGDATEAAARATAVTNALTTAAGDATTKAANAQSAAQTFATNAVSAEATARANADAATLTSANAHTDTAITTEQAARDAADTVTLTKAHAYTDTAFAAPTTPAQLSQRVGTAPPNPGAQRLIGMPAVMAAPPTVTQGVASAASAIASSVLIPVTLNVAGTYVLNPTAPFRYSGGNIVVKSQAIFFNEFVVPASIGGVVTTGGMAVEFEFDGLKFEFRMKGFAGSGYRIMVDGQYVASGPVANFPPADGAYYLNLVTFASRANRSIRIEFTASSHFGGIYIGPTDTAWSPSIPAGPRVIVFGDSYTSGTGATATMSAFWDTMGKALGWRDVWSSGVAGAGFLAPGTGVKLRDRVVTDVIAYTPDIVVVPAGINDVGTYTGPQIQGEATLLFAQIRAALPNVKLIVVGPWAPTGSPNASQLATRDAIKAATIADSGAHLYIDNIGATAAGANTLGWITGTGKVGTTAGVGNADLYISSDGVHPSQAGHDYIGRRLAAAIGAGMSL